MRQSLILVLAFAFSTNAAHPPIYKRASPAAAGGGAASPFYTESFEGTGYQNSWIEDSAIFDEDDTTMVTDGTQCLKVTQVSSSDAAHDAFTAQSIITIQFAFRASTTGTRTGFLEIAATEGGASRGFLGINASAKPTIWGDSAGSVSVSIADSFTANTTWFFQVVWNKSTGFYSIEANTTGTFNGSGTDYASASDGDTGVTIGALYLYSRVNSTTVYYDNIKIYSSAL